MHFGMTIAGSDSGAGAGMQQDLKTFTALGVYCATIVTSVTAQNTYEVTAIYDVPAEIVEAQIEAVLADFEIRHGKTGMLSNGDIVRSVARKAREHGLSLVVDPVMVSKSGAVLLKQEAVEALKSDLLSLALMVTPNIPEAEILSGVKISDSYDMEEAARRIIELGPKYVVIKGGHMQGETVTDLFYDGKSTMKFSYDRVNTKNTHGGGDTLSAAIAAYLSKGYEPVRAYALARRFMQRAIERALNVGKGYGPVNPIYKLLK
jgi:hydroxymethylpyrimidine/phosphomethylpyrimidine kinase